MKRPLRVLMNFGLVVSVSLAAFFAMGRFGVVIMLYYTWVTFTFYHYRYVRQEEVLHLLRATAGAAAPLAPAMRAYLHERRETAWRETWVAFLQLFVIPGYYWFWHRRHRFDEKVKVVTYCLESGYSLRSALSAAPGVVSNETLLAVAVGESTGKLNVSLGKATSWRAATLWLEAAPRLVYPLFLLLTIAGLLGFLMMFIIPKYEKIFIDFRVRLPHVTVLLINFARPMLKGPWLWLGILAIILVITALFSSSRFCWYFPLVGRFYRGFNQGRIMTSLSVLLESGTTVTQAMGILAESGYFGSVVRRRIIRARQRMEEGGALPESLYAEGLLPASMKPLLQSAQRAQHLPWAMRELGEGQARRIQRGLSRLTNFLFPVSILATGALVAFVVFGMFMPLLKVMAELNK